MIAFYTTIFLRPIFNALIWLYNLTGDVGVAILLLTIAVRVIILPVTLKSLRSQKAMQALQPKLNALKEKFKNDKQGLARATMLLYTEEKVSPASSCLPLLIQLPVFIALYQALRDGLGNTGFNLLYHFVHNPTAIAPIGFHFLNLAKASIPIAVLAGLSQFWQAKMLSAKKPELKVPGSHDESMMVAMNKQMLYVMPVMTVVIGYKLPGGVILYWLITNLLTIVQQYVFLKNPKSQGPITN